MYIYPLPAPGWNNYSKRGDLNIVSLPQAVADFVNSLTTEIEVEFYNYRHNESTCSIVFVYRWDEWGMDLYIDRKGRAYKWVVGITDSGTTAIFVDRGQGVYRTH